VKRIYRFRRRSAFCSLSFKLETYRLWNRKLQFQVLKGLVNRDGSAYVWFAVEPVNWPRAGGGLEGTVLVAMVFVVGVSAV
jgi:hypothetical protein